MRLLIALAILAHGCTDSNGEPCVPDRAGLVPADWVVAQVLAQAEAAGVEVCFLDHQIRQARYHECLPDAIHGERKTDTEQLDDCIANKSGQDWTEPQRRACLDVMASAPCQELEEGPCKVGDGFASTCYPL